MSTRKWIALFSALFVLSLPGAWWVLHTRSEQSIAVVSVSGTEIRRIDLSKVHTPYTFTVAGKNGENTISVAPGSIAIVDATCPDKLCVKHGPLKNAYSPIVCLPNKVTVTFANDTGFDAVSQ